MIYRFGSTLGLLAACAALGSSGCVIYLDDGPRGVGGDDTWEQVLIEDDDTSETSSSQGGAAEQGGGGAGGDTATGGTGGGETGSGGSGADDLECTEEFGTGMKADSCADLLMATVSCGELPSLGFASCERAFEIYNGGQAEELHSCLTQIDAADSCNEDLVAGCVASMYGDACESGYIAQVCGSWANACAEVSQPLDVARCSWELNPFNDDGLLEMLNCMNETEGVCQDRYDTCLDQVLTLAG